VSGKTAKLLRRAKRQLDPDGRNWTLERWLKRRWYGGTAKERRSLRAGPVRNW